MQLLYTPDEGALDAVTRTAKLLFDTPIVLISLLDHHRQWFKSCIGLPTRETSRDLSFCGHAILSDEIMVVEDATQDQRFADNPLVTDEPRIRFYAGRPLKNREGFKIGTLCLIDDQPRRLSPDELRALDDIARWAELAMLARELSDTQGSFLQSLDEESRRELLDPRLNIWKASALNRILEREVLRAYHQQAPLTVLQIELANHAQVRQQYGPLAAEALLAEVTRTLSNSIRAYDTLGLCGKATFSVILPNADESRADAIIARIKKACSLILFMPGDSPIDISVRLGRSSADFKSQTPEAATLFENAGREMSTLL
ncbi:GAF domain-containing protein [Azonexus sp. IMCC34839]|uniref:sensor domain-containing diguanylate cyclase n=1 Tax=Azonexus sp. IMCC34839 TaxID=3133695 RepID=UPI0039995314